jgi:hypothetical protein
MAMLVTARAAIALIPLKHWDNHLGLGGAATETDLAEARRLARHVDRGAGRLPFATKCLPRAIALSRMLRRRTIAHSLVLAARPAGARAGTDDLHAWLEVENVIVLGDLPGPWLILLRLPQTIR